MAEKKSGGWFSKIFDLLKSVVELVKSESAEEIMKLKKKVLHYFMIYSLFFTAILFIVVGFVKYLAEIGIFFSEGVGFMIAGALIAVCLAIYTIIKKID